MHPIKDQTHLQDHAQPIVQWFVFGVRWSKLAGECMLNHFETYDFQKALD